MDQPLPQETVRALRAAAAQARYDIIAATGRAGSGHPTSCLSAVEALVVLFATIMQEPDLFILSKGHAAPLLYALYHQMGLVSTDELMKLRTLGSPLEGHPVPRWPYVRFATGSLGQGLGIALGTAWHTNNRVFVLLGDSELSEGSVWEAVGLAAHYELHNLIAIIDANKLGQNGAAELSAEQIKKLFDAWGWHTQIVDGTDINALHTAYTHTHSHKAPCAIIMRTQKGAGIPELAGKEGWHGRIPTPEQQQTILARLKQDAHPLAPNQWSYKPTASHTGTKAIAATPPIPETYALGTTHAPRAAFGNALYTLGSQIPKLYVLDAEVGNSTYTNLFRNQFPERFFQAYIAEQSLISVATGLAGTDRIPVAATFGAFLTRAHDQLRMAAISRLPVRVVGTHVGCAIGQDGPSQMALEDIPLVRSLPGSIVLATSDAVSTWHLTASCISYTTGISYLRVLRNEVPVLYDASQTFTIGGCHILRNTSHARACIVTYGITVHEALTAHRLLLQENIPTTVIDCYSIKPLPIDIIIATTRQANNHLVIVEDHYPAGGLGEAVALACAGTGITITHLAVQRIPGSAKPAEQLHAAGIDAQAITKAVHAIINDYTASA